MAQRLDIFLLSDFLSLASARDILAGTRVRFGAQDVFWENEGPHTG